MTNDRMTLLVRLREVTSASSNASGNPVKKLHTAEHGILHTEPGASVGYAVENFLPRSAAERTNGRPVTLTLAANGHVVGIDLPRIGLPEPVTAPSVTREELSALLLTFLRPPKHGGSWTYSPDEAADALLARFTITPRTDR